MKKFLLISLLLPLAGIGQLTAISVNLYKGNDLMDGVAVYYNGQSDSVDNLDIQKLANPGANIAIINGSDTLAGEQRTSFQNVNLRLWNLVPGASYRLEIVTKNISTAFLIDSSTYNYVGESLGYAFVPQKDATNRFKIAFCPVLSIGNEIVPVLSGKRGLRLFPNPATSYINLDMDGFRAGKYKITFFGDGNSHIFPLLHTGNKIERINIHNLKRGTYFMVLESDRGEKITRQVLIR